MKVGDLVQDIIAPYNVGIIIKTFLCNETNDWNREFEYQHRDILALVILWSHGVETAFEDEVKKLVYKSKNEK